MQPWRSFFSKFCCSSSIMHYSTRQANPANTLDYRLYIEDASTKELVSPFHDIPLWADKEQGIINMVVEIPRWSNAKLEVCKEEALNPIKQDVKKGALRFVKNIFPYHGYPWNYGAIPQTWECPELEDQATGYKGDNDPVDAVEIGSAVLATGAVKQVKVLGCIALIDEGETDWKVIVVNVDDPLAAKLNDISDLQTHCAGLLAATHNWFRDYKIPDGKGANTFAFNGEYKDRAFALKVLGECHEMWEKLINGTIANTKGLSLVCQHPKHPLSQSDAAKLPGKDSPAPPPAPVDPSVTNQVYI